MLKSNNRRISLEKNLVGDREELSRSEIPVEQNVLTQDQIRKINSFKNPLGFTSPEIISAAGLDQELKAIKKHPSFLALEREKRKLIVLTQHYWPYIQRACSEMKLLLDTFKDWYETDENFKFLVDQIKDSRHQFLDARMYDEAIMEADDRRFILKHVVPEKYGDKPLVQIANFIVPPELTRALREEQLEGRGFTEEQRKKIIGSSEKANS